MGDSVQRNELILLVYLFLQPLTTTVHFNVVIQDTGFTTPRVAKLYSLQVYLDIYLFIHAHSGFTQNEDDMSMSPGLLY